MDTIDTGDCNDHINWGQSATVELFPAQHCTQCHTGRRDGGMAPVTNAGYLLPCRGQGVYVDTAVGGRCVISYYHGLTAGHCTDQQPGSHRCATPWPMQICLANCGVGVRCPGRGGGGEGPGAGQQNNKLPPRRAQLSGDRRQRVFGACLSAARTRILKYATE